jgi:hypothetical protein
MSLSHTTSSTKSGNIFIIERKIAILHYKFESINVGVA